MKITTTKVLHVAQLARLDLDAEAVERFSEQIGTVLEYVDTLQGVDTEGVTGTSHAISLTNAFREDVVKDHLDRDAALKNAPQSDEEHFLVPRVI